MKEYRQLRLTQLMESADIWRNVFSSSPKLNLDEFDTIFGHILADTSKHYTFYCVETFGVSASPNGRCASEVSTHLGTRQQRPLSAVPHDHYNTSLSSSADAREVLVVMALIADVIPCNAVKFIFELFACQSRSLSHDELMFMLSKVTVACSYVLSKPPDERLLHQHTKQAIIPYEIAHSVDFQGLWYGFQDTSELCEYVNSVLAIRHHMEQADDDGLPLENSASEASRPDVIPESHKGKHLEVDTSATEVRSTDKQPYLFARQLVDRSMVEKGDSIVQKITSSIVKQLLHHRRAYSRARVGFAVGIGSFEGLLVCLFERLKAKLKGELIMAEEACVNGSGSITIEILFRAVITEGIFETMDDRELLACSGYTLSLTTDAHPFTFFELAASGHSNAQVFHVANHSTDICVADRIDSLRIVYNAPRITGAVWHRPLLHFHSIIRAPLVLPPSAPAWRALDLLIQYQAASIAIASHRPAILLGVFSYETWRRWLELKLDQARKHGSCSDTTHGTLDQQDSRRFSMRNENPRANEAVTVAFVNQVSSAFAEGLLTPIIVVMRYVQMCESPFALVLSGTQTLSDAVRVLINSPYHVERVYIVTRGWRSNMVLIGVLLVSDITRIALCGPVHFGTAMTRTEYSQK